MLELPVRLIVRSVGVQECDAAAFLFDKIKPRFPCPECIFAAADYNAQQACEAAKACGLRPEIDRRNPNAAGFEAIKWRWVVERTFSW